MTDPTQKGVIRRTAVRMASQPTQVECGTSNGAGTHPIAVVPLLDGDHIAGFEIRCGCGASALVECIYQET